MNEKIQVPFIFVCFSVILFFAIGIWAGYSVQSGRDKAELNKITTELSDILIINKELSEANTKHIETIERLQGFETESTRHIQLLESGIAELERNGTEKDRRIEQAEIIIRRLSEEVDNLGRKVETDSRRFGEILKEFGCTENSDNNGNINNSGVSWNNNNFNYYKVNK
jgi:hypothetical protein